jgi:hypothetical protein
MTRQCAWCNRYLGLVTPSAGITHGICEHCASRVRASLRPGHDSRRSRGVLRVTKATMTKLFCTT